MNIFRFFSIKYNITDFNMSRPMGNRSCSVFVGNIPYDVDEEQLKRIFSTVGPIVSLRLMYDKVTRQPKGYGFCEYKDPETAYAAMRNLNNVECGGRPLRVDWADHELKATEGVMRQPGRSLTSEVVLKHARVKDPKLQEFIDRITTQEVAEELSADAIEHCQIGSIINQMSCAQMVNILGHMLRLIADSHESAKQLLTSHPQVALAVMQMAYLLGLSAEPALPMSQDDINYASERIIQLRNSKIAPQKPTLVPHLVNPPMGPLPFMLGAPPPALPPHLMMSGPPPPLPAGIRPPIGVPPPPLGMPPVARATMVGTTPNIAPAAGPQPAASGSGIKLSEEQKRLLIDQLSQLTPEQVAQLPEEVKRQVLEIMSSNS